MANITFDVATYNRASLSLLYNSNPFIHLLSKKFKDFDRIKGQLGSTVTFDQPPLVDFVASLAFGTYGDYDQKQVSLTVDQEGTIPLGVPELEELFNLRQNGYLTPLAKSGVATLSTRVGGNIARQCIDSTYLTYGDGTKAGISSYEQLATAVATYRDAGNPITDEMCGIIPMTAEPAIIGSGLNQFATNRNNEIANTWELGPFSDVTWYRSNLLPRHTAGSVGIAASTLTVISVNAAGTQLTMSGAAVSDADAIKAGDVLTFQDGVTGFADLRYMTYFGNQVTTQAVQVRAEADAASDGSGDVIVNIFPALISTSGDKTQTINLPVLAGQELKALKSHTAGLLFAKSAFFLAMPQLIGTSPFEGSTEMDPESGVSLRTYHGYIPETAQTGYVQQCAWGSKLVDRYGMRLAFPA